MKQLITLTCLIAIATTTVAAQIPAKDAAEYAEIQKRVETLKNLEQEEQTFLKMLEKPSDFGIRDDKGQQNVQGQLMRNRKAQRELRALLQLKPLARDIPAQLPSAPAQEPVVPLTPAQRAEIARWQPLEQALQGVDLGRMKNGLHLELPLLAMEERSLSAAIDKCNLGIPGYLLMQRMENQKIQGLLKEAFYNLSLIDAVIEKLQAPGLAFDGDEWNAAHYQRMRLMSQLLGIQVRIDAYRHQMALGERILTSSPSRGQGAIKPGRKQTANQLTSDFGNSHLINPTSKHSKSAFRTVDRGNLFNGGDEMPAAPSASPLAGGWETVGGELVATGALARAHFEQDQDQNDAAFQRALAESAKTANKTASSTSAAFVPIATPSKADAHQALSQALAASEREHNTKEGEYLRHEQLTRATAPVSEPTMSNQLNAQATPASASSATAQPIRTAAAAQQMLVVPVAPPMRVAPAPNMVPVYQVPSEVMNEEIAMALAISASMAEAQAATQNAAPVSTPSLRAHSNVNANAKK